MNFPKWHSGICAFPFSMFCCWRCWCINLSLGVSVRPEQQATRTDPVSDSAIRFLLAFGVISYLTWLKMFAIFRYILVIELLAPLGIWLILDRMISSRIARHAAAGASLLMILATLSPADWGRVSWGKDYFGAKLPVIEKPEDTIVIMTGADPSSYLVPLFSKAVRFVRIQSYFTGPSSHPNGYDRLMAEYYFQAHRPRCMFSTGLTKISAPSPRLTLMGWTWRAIPARLSNRISNPM